MERNNDNGTSVRLLSHYLAPLADDAGVLQKINTTLKAVIRRRLWHRTPVLAWRTPWKEEPGEPQSTG